MIRLIMKILIIRNFLLLNNWIVFWVIFYYESNFGLFFLMELCTFRLFYELKL